jgi:hypothetical protein
MARRPLRSPPELLNVVETGEVSESPEPSGPIDLTGFTRRLYGQALRVLVQIEAEHATMAIDDQCKLLNTLGVLGKNLIAMVKGSDDTLQAGAAIRTYAQSFVRSAPKYAATDDGGDDDDAGDAR